MAHGQPGRATLWGLVDLPYRCPNCRAIYETKAAAEAVVCPGCQVNTCGSCVARCSCCDDTFCPDCRTFENYGDGAEHYCAGCKAEAETLFEKCTGCNRPRADLQEREERDAETGYRAIERECADCRALAAAREFFDLSPINVVELSETALETCPF